jgi:hypothetical protein
MKKILINIFILTGLFFTFSCTDFLDIVPKEVVMEEDVWGNIKNAELVLTNLYGRDPGIPVWDDVYKAYIGASDEAWDHWETSEQECWKYNFGSWGITDNPYGDWDGYYRSIRVANLFIENIESVPLQGDQQQYYSERIPVFKAEARFLRAYYYFELFRRFGAAPLIRTSIRDINDLVTTQLPRNPADEIVDFIVSECDEIKSVLRIDYNNEKSQMGRVTRGAAIALKAKTLLYAASPLFNGNPLTAGLKNPDGTLLFSPYNREKWKLAADAAADVLKMADEGVYTLNQPAPDNPVHNYAQLFSMREWKECIFVRSLPDNKTPDQAMSPNGYPFQGWGKFSVFQELVDAYETANGLPINEDPTYSETGVWDGTMWDGLEYSPVSNVSNMYKHRDPRFYASIFFQYAVWRYSYAGRPVKYAYYGNRDFRNDDSDAWPWSTGTHNMSGYGARKWINPQVDILNNSGTGQRNLPVFRLAEFYLIYAEALNEYLDAPSQDVYNAINKVRKRVQMPDLPIASRAADKTQAGMRERIRNERRVELVFECQRFWDVRRWMIAADHDGIEGTDDRTLHGMHNRPSPEELEATGLDIQSEEAGVAVFYQKKPMQTRVFTDKHYLMPIPKTEMEKNPNMVQNPGWE